MTAQTDRNEMDRIIATYLPTLANELEIVQSASGQYTSTVTGPWPYYDSEDEARQGIVRRLAWCIMAGQGRRAFEETAAGGETVARAYRMYRPASQSATETCARCGDARDMFCPMSADGEGPHDIVSMPTLTASDADFLNRLAVHNEQGAAER